MFKPWPGLKAVPAGVYNSPASKIRCRGILLEDVMEKALQDLIEPEGICFGCGSANSHGLQIKSYFDREGTHILADVQPEEKYCGWPELVYGGYIAMLVDCHSNYAAMAAHYTAEGRQPGSLPKISCATSTLGVKYIRPTPMGVPLHLKARVAGEVARKTRVICEVWAGGILTARGDSTFVRVDTKDLADKAHDRKDG